ncbi:immunoglobulin domain-containing protein, partial [Sphingobacterium spiritivorum]|uniref:immunoglobulin domain-containing protein n=1 Tax=Sphingobacterium spiritivorum TaxID=258 RepID=UPI003DA27F92
MKLKWCYLICMLALLFYGMAGTAYAQRVYATAQLNSVGSNSSISGAANSTDTDYTNSTLITVPGLVGGATWQQLIFPSTTVPAGSTVFIRLSSGTGLLGGSISYQAYKNATTSAAGTTAATTTANFTDRNGNSFIAVTSSEAFNAVRITISGGLLATTSANVFYAFYEPPNTNCSTIAGTSVRVTGVALLGSISNPEYAIDESLTTASNFAGGLLGVGSELIQMVYFTNKSNVNDEVSVTFSVPPAPLLALGLFNNVTLNVYNGTTLVSTGNVGSLLSLDLLSLLRNGKRQTVSFKPTATFDRVEVVYATGVGLLNNFKLHEVARTPAKPTTPVAYPSVINACDGETVNISASSASSGAVLKWYKDSIGGTPVRTSSSNTDVFSPTVTYTPGVDTTFYFVTSSWSTGCYAQSQEVKIAVLVHPKPALPVIPNVATCTGTSATLTVNSPVAGVSYRWYTVASGGTALTTANSYTITNPTTTTTYYVEGYNATTGCISASRTAVTLTVNPLPAAPAIPNTTICAGTSATLSVSSPESGISYRWYTVASGGTALTTANSYTIANPTTTTTYYVEGYNAITGCISASRTAVTLTVNPLPAAPTISNLTTCAGTSATLTISSPAGGTTYNWYTVSTGGTSVHTGPTYTISNPTTTITYYVEAVSAGCISATRTAVTLTVNPLPAAPTIPNTTTCAGTSATLSVSSPVAGINYRWYTVASGGTALTTANSYTISNPTTTITYYVEGYNATTGCISASRTAVTLTVNPLPAAPTIPNLTTCAGTSATLTVSSPVGGTTYNWYTVSTGGTSVNTGATYAIANPTTTTTYYVEAVSASGCISATRTAVTL